MVEKSVWHGASEQLAAPQQPQNEAIGNRTSQHWVLKRLAALRSINHEKDRTEKRITFLMPQIQVLSR
jgi:hypothetical protein